MKEHSGIIHYVSDSHGFHLHSEYTIIMYCDVAFYVVVHFTECIFMLHFVFMLKLLTKQFP
jgi:hypothetical protein